MNGISTMLCWGQHQMSAISFRRNLSFWGHFLRSNDRAVVGNDEKVSTERNIKKKYITRVRIFSMKYNCHVEFFFSLFRFIWQYIHFFLKAGHGRIERNIVTAVCCEQVYSLFCSLLCISFILYCERKKIAHNIVCYNAGTQALAHVEDRNSILMFDTFFQVALIGAALLHKNSCDNQ